MSPTSFFNRHPRADFSAFLDGELSSRASERLEAHLASCSACAAVVEGLRETRAALRAFPEAPAPRSFALTPEMARDARPARLAPAAGPLQPLANGLRLTSAGLASALAVVIVIAVVGGGDGSQEGDDAGSVAQLESASLEFATDGDTRATEDMAGGDAAPTPGSLDGSEPAATAVIGSTSGGGGVGGAAGPTADADAAGAEDGDVPATVAPPASDSSLQAPAPTDTLEDNQYQDRNLGASGASDDEDNGEAANAAADSGGDEGGTGALTVVGIVLALLLGASVIGSIAASRLGQKTS